MPPKKKSAGTKRPLKRSVAVRKRVATVRHTKAVKKLAWRTGSVALLTACALVLAGPFTYDSQTHQELTESVQAWSVIGNRFLGLDLGAVRDNVFTLRSEEHTSELQS